jgi:hypothetical protein
VDCLTAVVCSCSLSPPVGRLLVCRGPGNGRRHQLVSGGSWMDESLEAGALTVLCALSHTPLTFVLSFLCPPPLLRGRACCWVSPRASLTLGRRASWQVEGLVEVELEVVSAGSCVELCPWLPPRLFPNWRSAELIP